MQQGDNPYINLTANFLTTKETLSANLNPSIVLWMFHPIVRLSYETALWVWSFFSFILGLIAAEISFHYAFSAQFLQKNKLCLYLFYLAFFPTLINTASLQLGTLLFFMAMLGYHFYLQQYDYLAGILWGGLIAIKLFPALLFFYIIKQGRSRVFWTMLAVLIITSLIPLWVYGPEIYKHYYTMMTQVLWYGDGWNASIYGFIFRLFVVHQHIENLVTIQLFYGALFFWCFFGI